MWQAKFKWPSIFGVYLSEVVSEFELLTRREARHVVMTMASRVDVHAGQEVEEDDVVCQVPKIQFADLLELIVRTGALDVDYLRPKKQPPSDGLGRGRVTEYEVLQDAIKSELLSIDDKGAGAQNASLDFGEFLEFVSVSVLGPFKATRSS